MDELQQAKLKTSLLAAQRAIQDALAVMGAPTPTGTGALLMAHGGAACAHPQRIKSMGGYWTCPDCGAEGREENT